MSWPRLSCVLLITAGAHGQGPLPKGAIDGPVGDETLARIVTVVLPLVEKHAGKRFKTPPVVREATAVHLQQLVRSELEQWYARIYAHHDEARRRWLASTVAAVVSLTLFGKYGFEDRVVYVAPDRLDATLRQLGQRRELGLEVLRLVVAHELAHALQDQHAAIGEQARSVDNDEAHLVLTTCMEAHATLIEQRVTAELGLVEAGKAWVAMQSLEQVRQAVGVGIHEVMGRSNRQWEELSYLRGADRLREVAAADGEEAVWQLVAKPPASSRFFAGAPAGEAEPEPRWSELFAGVERELGKGRWFVDRGPLNWLHLRSDLADLSAAEFETFEKPLLWVGRLAAARTVPTLSASVWALRFRDEPAARQALALSRQAAAREEDRLRKGKGLELRRFEFAEPKVDDGEALVHDISFRIPPLQEQKVRVVWRRRGRDLVRIWDQNLGRETSDLLAVADLLLRRMAE